MLRLPPKKHPHNKTPNNNENHCIKTIQSLHVHKPINIWAP